VPGGVHRFACTQCGACCNRSPEVELSEAAALADVFVFRLMFRIHERPRAFAGYLASGGKGSAEAFHESKRLLNAFAARKGSTRKRHGSKTVEYDQYLMISALTVDTGSGTCSALSESRCSIYERRPLACRTAPLHYARAEASAGTCLDEFVRTPGYRCDTGVTAPVVIDGNRIVDTDVRQARAEALEVADRDKSWHNAIAGRMRQKCWNDAGLPTPAEVESSAPFAATTTSMRIAWQIAAEAKLMGVEDAAQLIAMQAAAIDRELAAGRCAQETRQTLLEMQAEYRRV
jgi:Fe-S-cluster containining protein